MKVKEKIEQVWNDFPSYGHKRLSTDLKLNKKRILRVMKKFSIKPYRRHKKPFKRSMVSVYDKYPNLLTTTPLTKINQIWVTDFTYLWYKNRSLWERIFRTPDGILRVYEFKGKTSIGFCRNHNR